MTKIQELSEYWKSSAWSQSKLKSVMNLGLGDKSDTFEMFKGNLLDTVVTNFQLFDQLYYVEDFKRPTDEVTKIFQHGFKNRATDNFDTDFLLDIVKAFNYQAKWKNETLVEKVIVPNKDYWDALLRAEGKIVITPEEKAEALLIKDILLGNPNFDWIFKETFTEEPIFQKPLYYTLRFPIDGEIASFDVKGLPDIMVFDYTNKLIKIVDLKKTGVSRAEFPYIAKKFRYDLQSSFYKELVQKCYPDYEVEGSYWLVVPNNINKPYLHKVSEFDYEVGKWGATVSKGSVKTNSSKLKRSSRVFGWIDCFETIYQSKLINLPDYDLEYHALTEFKGSIWS